MKKYIKFILPAMLSLTLASCMDISLSYDIDKKGNFTQTATMMFDNALIESETSSSIDEYLEEMKEELATGHPNLAMDIVHDENKSGLSLRGESFYEPTIDKSGNTITLAIDLAQAKDILSQEAMFANTTIEEMRHEGGQFSIYVTMPAKPKTNVGSVKKNTVKIDLLETDADAATITCSLSNPLVPFLIALIVGLIALLTKILLRKGI